MPRRGRRGPLSEGADATGGILPARLRSMMKSLKARLEAFQRSTAGLFVKKVQDDQATKLASLLAWGTLSALLPLILGILGLTGLVIRDPERPPGKKRC